MYTSPLERTVNWVTLVSLLVEYLLYSVIIGHFGYASTVLVNITYIIVQQTSRSFDWHTWMQAVLYQKRPMSDAG